MNVVLAISGASGSIYARRCLELLSGLAQARAQSAGTADDKAPPLKVHWVASRNAQAVWQAELGEPMPEAWPHTQRWALDDFSAPFASGSNAPDAVLVAPCSMSALSRAAHGGGGDLIARACDVALKERRRLILMARETPLSLVHLRNMVAVTEAGAVVLPAVPSFYMADHSESPSGPGPHSFTRAVDSVVQRALDHMNLPTNILPRWGASTAVESHA